MLGSWPDLHRSTVREKSAGLAPRSAATAPLPTSPSMSVGGVVARLRRVEHFWFEVDLLGLLDQGPYTLVGPDAH